MALQPLGTLSYNGYDFASHGARTETTSVTVKPVPTSDGRTVRANRYAFAFRTVVAGAPTDAPVTAARRALTKYGGPFVFKNRGLGDLSVNVGSARDVEWGPKPTDLGFRYLGADRATELTWSIEVVVPDCAGARYQFAPAEFCYAVSWAIDHAGYTTITRRGHLVIPITRRSAGDRTLPDSADAYRERVAPAVPLGFSRTSQFDLSEDRTRLDFSIADEEMGPNAPPPGAASARASFSESTSSQAGFGLWTASLECDYELVKGADYAVILDHFLKLWKAKADAHRGLAGGGAGLIPVSFSASEPDVYGRPRVSLAITWTYVATSIRAVLEESGLWEPVPGSDWRKWALSMAKAQGPRGIAQATFDVGEDAIVDLCAAPKARPPKPPRTAEMRGGRVPQPDFDPTPGYLGYNCWLEAEWDSGTAELRTLPAAALPAPATPPDFSDLIDEILRRRGRRSRPAGAVDLAAGFEIPDGGLIGPKGGNRLVNNPLPGPPGGTLDNAARPAVVQQRVSPLLVVYLCGWALTAGFACPMPELTLVNGERPKPANRAGRGEGFASRPVFNAGGMPVFHAGWRLRYVFEKVPDGGLPAVPNPILGV